MRLVALVPRRPLPKVNKVVCSLTAKGRAFKAKDVTVQRIMGEGSFGQVFEGVLQTPRGPQRVVLKRVKARVQGAQEMGEMEHLLNVYAARAARNHCALFKGYCEVSRQEANTRLTEGLWLIWDYEGSKTLAYYLSRRDCLSAMASDMGIPESAAVATVMKQLLEGLEAFHGAGLVHRDVKPLNMILVEETKRFKLIDLGACADLRTGTNYTPEESILDPNYCPPEQYVLPTDAPTLSKTPLALAISPMLWAMHKPDRFDTWSAGIVMMQLAVPSLRTPTSVRSFTQTYARAGYDLEKWRENARLQKRDTTVLDAENGAGWELAQALLRPRSIEVDSSGGVTFVNNNQVIRMGAREALRHRFMRQAVEPMSLEEEEEELEEELEVAGVGAVKRGRASANVFQAAARVWRGLESRLLDLEAKSVNQASATRKQVNDVKRLRELVAAGKASPSQLSREEKRLEKMVRRLDSLREDVEETQSKASGIWRFLGVGGSGKRKAVAAAEATPAPVSPAAPSSPSGSWMTRLGSSLFGGTMGGSREETIVEEKVETRGTGGTGKNLWQAISQQLAQVESKLRQQTSATEQQSLTVRKLRQEVSAGKVDAGRLEDAEQKLSQMQQQLAALQRNYDAVKGEAARALSMLGGTKEETKASASTSSSSSVASSMDEPTSVPESMMEGIGKGATNFVYASLKFTGLATRVAGDLANALAKDAEKMFKDLEVEAETRKARRAADTAFMKMLGECQPSLGSNTTFEEAEAALQNDKRFTSVDEERRRTLFSAYIDALKKVEKEYNAKREADLRALYTRLGGGMLHTFDWTEMSLLAAKEEAFRAVRGAEERRRIFDELFQEECLKVAAKEAAFKAEAEFCLLLEEANPPVTTQCIWPRVKPQLWKDQRYLAVPEKRRRELFEEYVGALRTKEATEAAARAAAATDALLAAQRSGSSMDGELEQVDLIKLEELRKEQAQLRAEYEKMEGLLQQMEAKLTVDGQGGGGKSLSSQAVHVVTELDSVEEKEGEVVYKFISNGNGRNKK